MRYLYVASINRIHSLLSTDRMQKSRTGVGSDSASRALQCAFSPFTQSLLSPYYLHFPHTSFFIAHILSCNVIQGTISYVPSLPLTLQPQPPEKAACPSRRELLRALQRQVNPGGVVRDPELRIWERRSLEESSEWDCWFFSPSLFHLLYDLLVMYRYILQQAIALFERENRVENQMMRTWKRICRKFSPPSRSLSLTFTRYASEECLFQEHYSITTA